MLTQSFPDARSKVKLNRSRDGMVQSGDIAPSPVAGSYSMATFTMYAMKTGHPSAHAQAQFPMC